MPPGVKIVPTYDRSRLIGESIDTLRRTLIEEAIVVSLVIIVFLFHFRSALDSDPGAADRRAGVVHPDVLPRRDVEHHVARRPRAGDRRAGRCVDRHGRERVPARLGRGRTPVHANSRAADHRARPSRSARPIFFSLAIIVMSFVPVFLLEAQEGRMFRPLAFTKTFAMVAASILSITLVPVLMTIFIRGQAAEARSRGIRSRGCSRWIYEPILRLALRWKWTALLVNFAVDPADDSAAVRRSAANSCRRSTRGRSSTCRRRRRGCRSPKRRGCCRCRTRCCGRFPRWRRVFGTVGRGTTSTDNTPMGMVNTTVTLKPREQWRPGMTLEKLQAEMDARCSSRASRTSGRSRSATGSTCCSPASRRRSGIKILGPDLERDPAARAARSSGAAERARHAERVRRARGAGLFHRHRDRSRRHRAPRPDGRRRARM